MVVKPDHRRILVEEMNSKVTTTGGQDINAMTGQDLYQVANTMEHYVKAGAQYVAEYSK